MNKLTLKEKFVILGAIYLISMLFCFFMTWRIAEAEGSHDGAFRLYMIISLRNLLCDNIQSLQRDSNASSCYARCS